MEQTNLSEEQAEENPINELRTWLKVFAFGAIVAFSLLLLLGVVFVVSENSEDKETAQEELDARLTRSVENCLDNNLNVTDEREFELQQILEMGRIFFGTTPEMEAELAPEIEQFRDVMNGHLPYDQCSTRCVIARTDPTIDNCGPASNEAGDP